jgi:hypothetical protein
VGRPHNSYSHDFKKVFVMIPQRRMGGDVHNMVRTSGVQGQNIGASAIMRRDRSASPEAAAAQKPTSKKTAGSRNDGGEALSVFQQPNIFLLCPIKNVNACESPFQSEVEDEAGWLLFFRLQQRKYPR